MKKTVWIIHDSNENNVGAKDYHMIFTNREEARMEMRSCKKCGDIGKKSKIVKGTVNYISNQKGC